MNRDAFRLDVRQVRRAVDRAVREGKGAGVLHAEVERRMLERMEYVRMAPAVILDAGCGNGRGLELLRVRYPAARLIGVDFSEASLRLPRHGQSGIGNTWARLRRRLPHPVCADLLRLPLAGGRVDLVWSNLTLAWVEDAAAALREFHRVLAVGGLLMFSSYGPDSLAELRAAFNEGSSTDHVHPFADMHDLGDLLAASGFSDPVVDAERITLTYSNLGGLVGDLRDSGETYAAHDRSRGLQGRDAWRRMLEAYERRRVDGKLTATVEVIYGHAWKGEPRALQDGRQIVKWSAKPQR